MKWKAYNEKKRPLLDGKQCDLDIFIKTIFEGADDTLDREPREKKKKFIKHKMWEKIQERNEKNADRCDKER